MESTPLGPRPAELQVTELDLDGPDGAVLSFGPALPGGPAVRGGDVYALVRLRGRPVATVVCRVPPGKQPADAVAATARAKLAGREPTAPPGDNALGDDAPGPQEPRDAGRLEGDLPRTSVVVATRERADQLARTLDSLFAQDHPDFEIVVVDNAPATSATQDLVERKYGKRVRYARESVPGLAMAHNRGIAVADGAVIAFTDDDVVADPHWLTALTAPFAADPGLGCATGLILPARLRTPAQILLESHGGFAKGFAAREYDPAHPPADEPLFPFTAGSFGSGANMAFRATALRDIGGFDPATGTGTPARGGDDLYAFVSVLVAGHRLRYTPEALVWHHHRETWQDLKNQAYGYGAGLTAYLTAVLARHPAMLPSLLRKLPRGLAHARTITAHRDAAGAAGPGGHGAQDYPWPRHLSRLERRGMLAGPLGYAKARRRVRGLPLPWDQRARPQGDG
ncbi:glycosyltransferase [Streptomyces sp. NPDC019890]|uniref:glycosyltransferase n=1 Tax=Streptomyces sp. NPDC019890 TaxID=3365064 RepID=UPI003850C799